MDAMTLDRGKVALTQANTPNVRPSTMLVPTILMKVVLPPCWFWSRAQIALEPD